MEAETKHKTMSSQALARRRRPIPFLKEHRTNVRSIETGAVALRRAYFSNGLSRRTREGLSVARLERKLAEHCGFASLEELPITLALKVRLLIGNLLYISLAEPTPDSKTGSRDIHCAMNTVSRILTELGLKRIEKPVNLQDYLAEMARRKGEGANSEQA
jgi:hypothetical protein